MKLSEYPIAIFNSQSALINADSAVQKARDIVAACDAEIEQAIAFDPELKNEQQRKAKRHELISEDIYQAALMDQRRAEQERDRLRIELEFLKNQFSVAKLELRLRTAELEAAA